MLRLEEASMSDSALTCCASGKAAASRPAAARTIVFGVTDAGQRSTARRDAPQPVHADPRCGQAAGPSAQERRHQEEHGQEYQQGTEGAATPNTWIGGIGTSTRLSRPAPVVSTL